MEKIMNLLKGKKSGITIIEGLIVFAAAIALVATGLALYKNLQNSGNIKNETTNIASIIKRVTEVFGEDDMSSLVITDFINAGVYAPGTRIISDVVYHAWNGTIVITPTAEATWDLTYTRVPVGDACIDLVSNTRKIGFDNINISGGNGAMDKDVTDIIPTDITSACSEDGGNNEVTIVWSND